jgi:hypothetical protein
MRATLGDDLMFLEKKKSEFLKNGGEKEDEDEILRPN